jgi:hypothetical protein
MKKLLITFGCSWTFGVGASYEPGMSPTEYRKITHCVGNYPFRSLLCDDYNMQNLNFSVGGSSNQEQFRTAENFFCSNDFCQLRDQYDKILVLWGLTSVFRNEAYFNDNKQLRSYFYTNNLPLSKAIIMDHFDSQNEINLLSKKINFWNKFFDVLDIKNIWFDTFNHHDYDGIIPEKIQQDYANYSGQQWPSWQQFKSGDFTGIPDHVQKEILDKDRWDFYKYFGICGNKKLFKEHSYPRDLLSQLAIQNGMPTVDNTYHLSDWDVDSDRVAFLVDKGILNPYSHHPTKQGHRHIANMLAPALDLD